MCSHNAVHSNVITVTFFALGLHPDSGGLVTDEHGESVDVEDDNQEVFDGEEDEHLVHHVEVDHDGEADHQERPVLDEQSLHSAPDISPEVREEGGGALRGVL